jgi:hypothetical protein
MKCLERITRRMVYGKSTVEDTLDTYDVAYVHGFEDVYQDGLNDAPQCTYDRGDFSDGQDCGYADDGDDIDWDADSNAYNE